MTRADTEIIPRISWRFQSWWLWGYARGKMRTDPVYRASWERIGGSTLPLLDVGCGIGLHAFYLRERGFPAEILGLDLDARKVAAGRAVAQQHYPGINLHVGNALELPDFSGHVSMLDVLHYFPRETQSALLRSLAARVAPGGWCIIRTTRRDESWRFRVTQLEERFVRGIAWMAQTAVAFPSLEDVTACFPDGEWEHDVRPLWGRTPFNSWLLAFRRR